MSTVPLAPTSEMERFIQLVQNSPELSRQYERVSAYLQGKGFGDITIGQEVSRVLELLDRTPLLAIDIGGNTGDYTAELRKINPALEVHTFEPSSTNIAKLAQRFHDDQHVRVVPSAVSGTTGTATLFSNEPGSYLASLTQRRLDHFNVNFDCKESVATVRFEEYWTKVLQKRVLDIVKIDIEGHELAALNGFGDALGATRVLQFEFGGCNIDTRTYFQDFWYFFTGKRFGLYRITPMGLEEIQHYRESDEYFSTTIFIAVNKVLRGA